jgi:multisubunit Na+/H+ antiporter MnhC subunit
MVTKMNENTAIMLVLVLVIASCLSLLSLIKAASGTDTLSEKMLITSLPANSTSNPTNSPASNATQSQQPTSQQPQSTPTGRPSPLPSPFIIAVFIVALVAVFGMILSLCLRKRGKTKTVRNTTGERFWVIDCYGYR